ncbi:uncharacterized protein LOC143855731 [Tasmannia lanceolata]|uniref:uncharacterized protein LOC143855731 n=1 Tax=Tasmannia lanceolata TaxID=3420 RepID=UPI0040641C76
MRYCATGEEYIYYIHDYSFVSLVFSSLKADCLSSFQVWLFEHTTLWAPSAPDAHPRLLKWITGIDTRRTDHAAFIRQIRDGRLKKTQVVRCLLPLPREEGLLSFTADEADTVMGEKEASATAPTVEECLQDIRILEEETIASLSDMLRKVLNFKSIFNYYIVHSLSDMLIIFHFHFLEEHTF